MNTAYKLLKEYQQLLAAKSSPKTKDWWERYMKHVIPFRGVGIPENRSLLDSWREERFAKTAVGWVLRELSNHDADTVVSFIKDHHPHFSAESLKNATKKMDPSLTAHLP